MNVQSISIVVPTKKCVNNCKFCVSKMHENHYQNHFDKNNITKRIKYAVNNGVNTCIITGTGEALQNRAFLNNLVEIFDEMGHPFPNVELQTSGVLLTNFVEMNEVVNDKETENKIKLYSNIDLLNRLRVNTISLSVSNIFDDERNNEIIGTPSGQKINLKELTSFIKERHFNLRLSLNMTSDYDSKSYLEILDRCKELKADQITFRKLYADDDGSEESQWVFKNKYDHFKFNELKYFIKGYPDTLGDKKGIGTPLYRLPFGAMVYSYNGMSIAIDSDCMSKEDNEKLKYVIIREDGKLYCRWDDKGSLIF
ncbi:MAG: radical SAM protein [bacterium]